MLTIRNTSVLLLLVGVCCGLPQYPGQGSVDGDLQQQQGGLVPVTSQCATNQGCVPYFQCIDGYINTDGAGLIDIRIQPKGTCTEPDYPDIPALCCNIPGIPEPSPPVHAPGQGSVDGDLQQQQGGLVPVTPQCSSNQGCVPYFQCIDGYINTDGTDLIDIRIQPKGTCTEPDYPDIPALCCNIPGIPEPTPPVHALCPVGLVCIPEAECQDIASPIVPFDVRLTGSGSTCGESNIPGVCCANSLPPSSSPYITCPGEEVCVSIGEFAASVNEVTDGSAEFKQCFIDQTTEVGYCSTPPKQILDVCPLQSRCMPQTLCEDQIIDNTGNLIQYVRGGSWPGCAIDGNTNNPGLCCLNPTRIVPKYPVADQCGVRNTVPVLDQRIQSNIAYNEAQFGEFPWQAIIFSSNYTFKCGASIIGDRWIVTAAHCVGGFTPYDFTVRVGEWQVNTFDEPKPYLDVDVAAVTIHPQFNSLNVHNDIAVLELVEPLIFRYHINSICLPGPGQTFWGQRCISTGWGKDAFAGQYQHIMKKVELPTVEHHQCQSLLQKTRLGKFYRLDDSFMCAGGEENKDACTGDGGGPLACQDPVSGRYVLTGITAFGIGCGTQDVPGVYADVQTLLPFVQAVVAGSYDPNTFNQQQQQQIVEVETLNGYGK